MQGFGRQSPPSSQRIEHPYIVIAYTDPTDATKPQSGSIVARVKRHDGRTRIRGAIFFEPDYGSPDLVSYSGSTISVAEYIIANSKISKVFDVIGSRDFPAAFPTQGLSGIAFETRDLADGVEILCNLQTPSVKGRFTLTASLVPDQRMTMDEWHAIASIFNIDEVSALHLGNL